MIPVPLEWWKFAGKGLGDWFAFAYAGLNFAFFGVAWWTLRHRPWWESESVVVVTMLATIAMRWLVLLTIDNSEPRYTLEFFPVLIVLGSGAVGRLRSVSSPS